MKKKKLTDWLTPKLYKPDQQEKDTPDDVQQEVLEKTLLDIQDSIDRCVEEQEALRSKADDTGKFGLYRFRDGYIAGLKTVREYISDLLADIWGM